MNFEIYDRLQIQLAGVGSSLRSDMKEILAKSQADEKSKELVEQSLTRVSKSLDELAIMISQALQAAAE